jgi:hypothetical protein
MLRMFAGTLLDISAFITALLGMVGEHSFKSY